MVERLRGIAKQLERLIGKILAIPGNSQPLIGKHATECGSTSGFQARSVTN